MFSKRGIYTGVDHLQAIVSSLMKYWSLMKVIYKKTSLKVMTFKRELRVR